MYSVSASPFNSRGASLYGGSMLGGWAAPNAYNSWADIIKGAKYFSVKRGLVGLTKEEKDASKALNALIRRARDSHNPAYLGEMWRAKRSYLYSGKPQKRYLFTQGYADTADKWKKDFWTKFTDPKVTSVEAFYKALNKPDTTGYSDWLRQQIREDLDDADIPKTRMPFQRQPKLNWRPSRGAAASLAGTSFAVPDYATLPAILDDDTRNSMLLEQQQQLTNYLAQGAPDPARYRTLFGSANAQAISAIANQLLQGAPIQSMDTSASEKARVAREAAVRILTTADPPDQIVAQTIRDYEAAAIAAANRAARQSVADVPMQ